MKDLKKEIKAVKKISDTLNEKKPEEIDGILRSMRRALLQIKKMAELNLENQN